MIKKLSFILVTVFIFSSEPAEAIFTDRVEVENKYIGVGITIGRSIGLSFKKWLDVNVAINGDIAWSTVKQDEINLRIQYLIHNLTEYEIDDIPLSSYAGGGTRLKLTGSGKDNRMGIRGTVGTNYIFYPVPVEVFLEASPIFDLVPETTLSFDLNIGFHYYF